MVAREHYFPLTTANQFQKFAVLLYAHLVCIDLGSGPRLAKVRRVEIEECAGCVLVEDHVRSILVEDHDTL
jgi:hypothetical protein